MYFDKSNSSTSHLHIAAEKGLIPSLRKLLEQGVNPNAATEKSSENYPGYAALHFAAKQRSLEAIQVLLKYGANPCCLSSDGLTPLLVLLDCKVDDHSICQKAPWSIVDHLHEDDLPMLSEIISSLLKNQPDKSLNYTNSSGISHLHAACLANDIHMVEEFLKSGSNVNCATAAVDKNVSLISSYCIYDLCYFFKKSCVTLLQTALHFCNYQLALLLMVKHDIKIDTNDKDYILTLLRLVLDCEVNFYKFAFKPLRSKSKYNIRLNHWFSKKCKEKIRLLEVLIGKYNVDVNLVDGNGRNCLFYFFDDQRLSIISEISNTDRQCFVKMRQDIIKFLIENKASTKIIDTDGCNILHQMARSSGLTDDSDENIVTLFIEHGVDINSLDKEGKTPLFSACNNYTNKNEQDLTTLVKIFLKLNADINIKIKDLGSILHTAWQKHVNVIDMLLENGANMYLKDKDGLTAFHRLLTCIGNMASLYENSLIRKFLANGGSLNDVDNKGCTPAHYFCEDYDAVGEAETLSMIILEMINNGANFNAINNENQSAFGMLLDVASNLYSSEPMEVICMHVERCKILGLPVRDEVIAEIEIYKEDEFFQLHQYYSNLEKSGFVKKCREEISKMKETKIAAYPFTSLYDLLFKNVHEMTKFTINVNFQSIVEPDYLNTNFENYGYILNYQFIKGNYRRKLLDKATYFMEFLFSMKGMRWPLVCSHEFFGNFSNKELFNLVNNDLIKNKLKI